MDTLFRICVGYCNGRPPPCHQDSVLFSYLTVLNTQTFHGFARNYGDLIGMS